MTCTQHANAVPSTARMPRPFQRLRLSIPTTISPLAWMFVPAPMMCPLGVALAVPSTDQDAGRVSARWSRKSGNSVLACSSIAAANGTRVGGRRLSAVSTSMPQSKIDFSQGTR